MRGSILLVLFSFLQFSLYAGAFSGNVRDSVSGQPVDEVLVTARQSKQICFTDIAGHFQFTGLSSDTLELHFYAPGYKTKTGVFILQPGNETVNIVLEQGAVQLHEVVVSQQRDLSRTVSAFDAIDKNLRPCNSAQDLLRIVPGLFIAQHAGGGKAEQIFLRGFDADHGTDFSISIDGMPVNMVSHAHGQGYADFHFVIPETVDRMQVSKGPYSARFGDFATSGAGEFFTKDHLDNAVKVEGGMFNTYRTVGLFNLNGKFLRRKNSNAWIAGEYYHSDSYFDNPQHMKRLNLAGKYTTLIGRHSSLAFGISTFSSSWDASGQIPERAVKEGLISRFGSIDPSEGGSTARTNVNLIFTTTPKENVTIKNQFYYMHYRFDLFSDFTFFLQDSIHGDQIRQREPGRNIFGYTGTYEKFTHLFGKETKLLFGAGTRIDHSEVGLYHAEKREILDTVSDGNLFEQNIFSYAEATTYLTDKFSVKGGLRADEFIFACIPFSTVR